MAEKEYHTVREAADIMGVSLATVRRYIKSKEIEGDKIGGVFYIPVGFMEKKGIQRDK